MQADIMGTKEKMGENNCFLCNAADYGGLN